METPMSLAAAQDHVNARVYHSPAVVGRYHADVLEKAEVCAFLKHQPSIAGCDVLDIGVGTGRTAIYLAPLARRYLGVDYSPFMIERARQRLPGIAIELADMRDLKDIPPQDFDFVLATNNVLDAVGHDDRLEALIEWRRVVRRGGMLMFSTHNRAYEAAWRGPRVTMSRNPVTLALHVAKAGRQWFNYMRLRHLRHEEPAYALLTDTGHDYACLHYYIDRQAQAAQLLRAGFAVEDVFDVDGACLQPDDMAPKSPWLMYVARAV